jgi:hypothetical protein
VGAYIWNTGINPWGTEEKALKIVSGWLRKALQDAGITDYNELVIDYAGVKLSDLMLALVSNHPNYFTTAVLNGEGLGAAHYPELCYAWLASMDSNYVGTTANRLNNGGFRIIRINCEVDVKVFVADSYEKRMDQQIRISKNSSAFFKSREIILSVAIFIMFTLSFFADLIISGTLHQSKYSTSSLQSVWQFDLAPLMLTVRGTIIWLYVTRLMSLFITYGIFVLVAKQVRSVKKYVMLTSGLIAVMSAAAHYVGALSPYMFAAVTSFS